MTMARDRHALAVEGAVDQLGKSVPGFGDAVGAHGEIIAIG